MTLSLLLNEKRHQNNVTRCF